MEIHHVVKILIQIVLMAAFLYFFGIPTVYSYLDMQVCIGVCILISLYLYFNRLVFVFNRLVFVFDKQVLTVTSQKYPGKVVPPTITIVAFDSADGGWKQPVPVSSFDALKTVCGESVDITGCIKQNTHSLGEAVYAELGYNQSQSLMSPDLWIEDFTDPWYGRSYTLKYQEPRGTSWKLDAINLNVNTSDGLARRIFFHDPDYFLISVNPLSLPVNLETIKKSTSGRFYFSVALTEHEELSTPEDPCSEQPGYSFQGCIKESLSRQEGCRMHWDNISDQARPVCKTMAQYEPFANMYEILKDASMREITTRTGCQKPCKYMEYVVVNGPLVNAFSSPEFHLSLEVWMITTDITVKTEQLILTPANLVAQIGGTLSLFLGISFMTLWDGITKLENMGRKVKSYFVIS
jgi:hypothetical protein